MGPPGTGKTLLAKAAAGEVRGRAAMCGSKCAQIDNGGAAATHEHAHVCPVSACGERKGMRGKGKGKGGIDTEKGGHDRSSPHACLGVGRRARVGSPLQRRGTSCVPWAGAVRALAKVQHAWGVLVLKDTPRLLALQWPTHTHTNTRIQ